MQRTDVVDVIDLQQREALAFAVENVVGFVDDEGIRAAAEGGDHHEMDVVGGVCHVVGRFEDAVRVGPLGHGHQFPIDRHILFTCDEFRDHIDAHIGDAVGNLMLDERVGVIGTACQNHDHTAFFLGFGHNLHRFHMHLFEILFLGGHGRLDGLVGDRLADAQ